MTPVQRRELLKNFFNALPIAAQGGTDVTSIYVNRAVDEAHDPVAQLKQYIDWSETGGTYLFSGLRGAGKTTELNRLVTELSQSGVAAYYCDASNYLNLNDPQLTLPELLMAALAGLSDAVRKAHGVACLNDSIWDRARRVMNSEVILKPKLKVGTDNLGMEIEASLQENPEFKKKLNEFAKESSEFYEEAQTFALDVSRIIEKLVGSKKIVLIVDSLERLSAPSGEENKLFDSLKEIFFNNPNGLRFPCMSVVYSAPPYLSAVLPGVNSGFTHTLSLPNFKVMCRPNAVGELPQRNQPGISQMVDIVEHRYPQWREALSIQVLEHLAWMSGGNVRRYFDLIRMCVSKTALGDEALPVSSPGAPPVRQAISSAAEPLQWLTELDRKWLDCFKNSDGNAVGQVKNLLDDLPSIIRLFDHSLVLNYQNGSTWHNVPPLVREYV
jgi:hypothetical protein